jgi:carbonic anhydrase/acetyltransferase-like protein (isoleucine patch superfamily)
VGHKVLLHGCTIGDRVLVGMSSSVMDGAIIEDDVILGAGSLVTPGKRLESGHLYAGSPARQVRPLKPEEYQYLKHSAQAYAELKNQYQV